MTQLAEGLLIADVDGRAETPGSGPEAAPPGSPGPAQGEGGLPGRPAPVRGRRRVYEHGTLASYTHGACRCDDCRRVNTVYHRELRQRLRARIGTPEAHVPHGTAGGYANHGCRCSACSEAHQEAMSLAYVRRRSARRAAVASLV